MKKTLSAPFLAFRATITGMHSLEHIPQQPAQHLGAIRRRKPDRLLPPDSIVGRVLRTHYHTTSSVHCQYILGKPPTGMGDDEPPRAGKDLLPL